MMRSLCTLLMCAVAVVPAVCQKAPPMHVLAFYSTTVEADHVEFAKEAIPFFAAMGARDNFDFDGHYAAGMI